MSDEKEARFMRQDEARPDAQRPGMLARIGMVIAGVIALGAALVFSVVVFAVAMVAGLLVWGYLWWTTRDLRHSARRPPAGGRIIDGEVVREARPRDGTRR